MDKSAAIRNISLLFMLLFILYSPAARIPNNINKCTQLMSTDSIGFLANVGKSLSRYFDVSGWIRSR